MTEFLNRLLPRLFPTLRFLCVSHRGKRHLAGSIPRKLRTWNVPGDRFVVVQDNDNTDCVALKGDLRGRCTAAGREDTLIRIVCQEMEAWYLGDPSALAAAYGDERLLQVGRSSRFRDPDARPKPSDDVKRLAPHFEKVEGARRMAEHMSRYGNRSRSFQVFLDGIERLMQA